eukprot:CAMPEP_0114247160 /NCGR_PEP_ID=MMETSP0058-20121206/12872_1 /TAXON_ID=36894 /ORGANISM="Pyramimonas parkeae, CCMP726" /LENGTH=583 /DNA_ID=CAMNT_0001360443 /DNA_START=154 /DNA_END=1905 /DNA_ORIENTATION=+
MAPGSSKGEGEDGLGSDPQQRYYRLGKDAGQSYKLKIDGTADTSWIKGVPQIRRRTSESRQRELLTELAMVNERLSGVGGKKASTVRQRLDYLKMRRENWELIYTTVTQTDAEATLASIEEANRKVEEALDEQRRDKTSVTGLKSQLEGLQSEVQQAHSRLHATEARVAQNIERISALKAEAEALAMCEMDPEACVVEEVPYAEMMLGSPTGAALAKAALAEANQAGRGKANVAKGLEQGFELSDNLRNFWFPIEFSSLLKKDVLVPLELFDEPWVLFRDADGLAACVKDECAHRACPLSLGEIVDGQVECPYHGWAYNRGGECTKMPSTPFCKGVGVKSLTVQEQDGLIWVWPGGAEPTAEVPRFYAPEGFTTHAELMLDVPVEHGLLIENLLDLAHAPFTHTSTFAKGWSIPDLVNIKMNGALVGNWDPYPIDMSFEAPCITLSTIGLARPGQVEKGLRAEECPKHLYQMHVCLPSKKGHTRLLYRMALDFMPWVQYVPFIDNIWQQMANQVLGEDLRLVLGQQERMAVGSDTWANPVSYDKLGVRYRRWRNSLDSQDEPMSGSLKMSAGELFDSSEHLKQ